MDSRFQPAGAGLLLAAPAHREAFQHIALLYGDENEYLTGARQVAFTDAGRNPGRLIGAVRAFADRYPGRPVSTVAEPAEQTHPLLACPAGGGPSAGFPGPDGIPPQCLAPLPRPPADAEALGYTADLGPARELVARRAAAAGLSPDRVADLVIAAGELTANTLAHTPGGGTVRVWQTAREVICEVSDRGWIRDPLAGRRPPAGEGRGYGLWVVHQVCDLVETRSGPAGTTTRCHLRLPGPA